MKMVFCDNTVEGFIKDLPPQVGARVLRTLELLEFFGKDLRMPHAKKICKEIFELRIHGKQKVRILYTFQPDKIILLRGFIKKSQKIPKKELSNAMKKLRAT